MSGIVVSLDRSADSQHALEWAVTHATREHTPLTVLAVHRVAASPWTGNPIIYRRGPARSRDKTVNAVKEAVSKTMSQLGDDRPSSVTVRGFIGQPADALIEASHDADMVVDRGPRPCFARFHSVSAQVTHHAACPVVVVSGLR